MPDYRKHTLLSGHAHMSVRYYTRDAKVPSPNPFAAPPWGEDAGLSEVYSTLWTRTHVRTVLYMWCKSPLLWTHSLHHLRAKMPDYRKYTLLSGHAHMSARYYTRDEKAPSPNPFGAPAWGEDAGLSEVYSTLCTRTNVRTVLYMRCKKPPSPNPFVAPLWFAALHLRWLRAHALLTPTQLHASGVLLTYASSVMPTRRTAWINNWEIYRRLSMTAPHKNRNPIREAHNLPRAKMQSTSCTTFLTLHRGSFYKKATSLLPH